VYSFNPNLARRSAGKLTISSPRHRHTLTNATPGVNPVMSITGHRPFVFTPTDRYARIEAGKGIHMTKQKYEREIVDILDRIDRQGRSGAAERRRQPEANRPAKDLRSMLVTAPGWSSRAWLALILGLPLLAVLLQQLAPLLAALLAVAGVVLFLAPVILGLGGLIRRDQRPLWRGRVVEMPNRGDSFGPTWRYRLWAWQQRWDRWRGGRR
jgi:hypothetical protein